MQATFEAIWQRMCQGKARSTTPSPSLILASPHSPPLSLPLMRHVAPSVLFVSTRKPINPLEPISPRGEKISLAHIMTNSCRLFGLRHDNGEEGRREQEGDGENVGVGKDEKVMAIQCYPR